MPVVNNNSNVKNGLELGRDLFLSPEVLQSVRINHENLELMFVLKRRRSMRVPLASYIS